MTTRKKTKTIPSIVGLLMVSIMTLSGVYLIQQTRTTSQSQASGQPLSVRVANIGSQTATVYWLSQEVTTGSVQVDGKVFLDSRDQQNDELGNYLTHYVIVDGLEPATNYQFSIIANGQSYQEEEYTFATAESLAVNNKEADLAFGLLVDQQNQPLSGALITISLTGAANLASLTDDNGFWSVPLGTAYQKDLSALINYDLDSQILEIVAQTGNGQTATVITNTGNDHPVPLIVIGNTYDYSQNDPVTKQQPEDFDWTSLEIADQINQQLSKIQEETDQVTINNPDNQETLFTTQPEFTGQGPANQKIKITVESDNPQEEEVTISDDGEWQWTPPQDLTAGQHTLTIEYYDEDNLLQTITRTFIVQAASSSPTPTPITPLPTATPTSAIVAAITSTPTPQPTATPTTKITTTPTATVTATSSTQQMVTGNLTPLFILAMLGLSLIYFSFRIFQKYT